MQPSVTHRAQQGFTLVEMAFVILILGIVVSAFFNFLTPMTEQKNQQVTLMRQDKIARAISNYMQKAMVLPCPGNPNIVGALAIGEPRATCNGAGAGNNGTRVGIVPFRLLGLTQDDATDGFGNPFTYAVTLKAVAAYAGGTTVHNQCRTTTGTVPWISGGANNYPAKAVFCCQQQDAAATRLEVFDSAAMSQLVTANQTITTGAFGGQNASTGTAAAGDNLNYFIYVLVSHGKNGDRSYIWGNTARKAAIGTSTGEAENADDDTDFVSAARSAASGTAYFDDIVLWRTQQRAMSELGNDSCARP